MVESAGKTWCPRWHYADYASTCAKGIQEAHTNQSSCQHMMSQQRMSGWSNIRHALSNDDVAGEWVFAQKSAARQHDW